MKVTKIAMGFAASLLLTACAGVHGVNSQNYANPIGINKLKPNLNEYCLYNAAVPKRPTNQTKVEFQYVAFDLKNGEFRRYEAQDELSKKLTKANTDRKFDVWEKALIGSDSEKDFKEIKYVPNGPRPRPNRPLNRKTVTTYGPNKKLQENASPLDIEMHYYTQLTFISLDKNLVFDDSQLPFRVAVGNTKKSPPFIGSMNLKREKSMFTVTYYSGRDKERPELPPLCVYDYELNMIHTSKHGIVSQVTIDPKNGGDGAPLPD